MADRLVVCMVIDGKATLYEQGDQGADAFSTLRVPEHFDEDRAMAWALGTLSVLAYDDVHETHTVNGNGHRALPAPTKSLPMPTPRFPLGAYPSYVEVLEVIRALGHANVGELSNATGTPTKTLSMRLGVLRKRNLAYFDGITWRPRSGGTNGTKPTRAARRPSSTLTNEAVLEAVRSQPGSTVSELRSHLALDARDGKLLSGRLYQLGPNGTIKLARSIRHDDDGRYWPSEP